VGGTTRLPFVVECYRQEFERRPFHPTAYLGVSEQNCTQLHAHMDMNTSCMRLSTFLLVAPPALSLRHERDTPPEAAVFFGHQVAYSILEQSFVFRRCSITPFN